MTADSNDAALVAASVAGNRDAFAQIVSRYQSLICSLAYSSTGSLSQSEDLAQETFLTAWKQLGALREPEKLRSWLCGISRNLIHNALRRQGREPSHAATSLDDLHETAAIEPLPTDQAISHEEQAILWRSLERIPETYREPLVLFYREEQSIQRVAEKLELSEDAVKQRLSRGRKLLAEEVTNFVEGALKTSNPGRGFTLGVIAALPAFAISANAAAIGATAAKGSATATAAGAMGLLGAFLSFPLAIFGNYIGYRMSLDGATSDREREHIKTMYRRIGIFILVFFLSFGAVLLFGFRFIKTSGLLVTLSICGLAVCYAITTIILMRWSWKRRQKIVAEMRPKEMALSATPSREYRSKLTLLGLPFIHLRIGGGLAAQAKPVKAWIAAGDCAFGVLFAFGGIAIAPISIGGCAIGLIPFGGCAFGVLALGGLGVGIWSFGGLAFGWQAFGGCAIAWNAAMGGAAFAREFALGGIAHALEANNKVAAEFIQPIAFFHYGQIVLERYLVWMNLIWVAPMLVWWRIVRKAKR